MTLREWLQVRDLKPEEFAPRIQVTRRSIYRYLSGERFPRRAVISRIETETGGAVRWPDWANPEARQSA